MPLGPKGLKKSDYVDNAIILVGIWYEEHLWHLVAAGGSWLVVQIGALVTVALCKWLSGRDRRGRKGSRRLTGSIRRCWRRLRRGKRLTRFNLQANDPRRPTAEVPGLTTRSTPDLRFLDGPKPDYSVPRFRPADRPKKGEQQMTWDALYNFHRRLGYLEALLMMGVQRGIFRNPLASHPTVELEPFYHEPTPDLNIPDTYAQGLTLGVRETVEPSLRERRDPAASLPDQPIYDEPEQSEEMEWDEPTVAKTPDSAVHHIS